MNKEPLPETNEVSREAKICTDVFNFSDNLEELKAKGIDASHPEFQKHYKFWLTLSESHPCPQAE